MNEESQVIYILGELAVDKVIDDILNTCKFNQFTYSSILY